MKGYTDEKGCDRPPCGTCKYKNEMTVGVNCYNCIDILDLATHKPNAETEFTHYEAEGKDNA